MLILGWFALVNAIFKKNKTNKAFVFVFMKNHNAFQKKIFINHYRNLILCIWKDQNKIFLFSFSFSPIIFGISYWSRSIYGTTRYVRWKEIVNFNICSTCVNLYAFWPTKQTNFNAHIVVVSSGNFRRHLFLGHTVIIITITQLRCCQLFAFCAKQKSWIKRIKIVN